MNYIKRLKELGLSKYKIASICGVSWNAVNFWEKGTYHPNPEHEHKLYLLVKEYSNELER